MNSITISESFPGIGRDADGKLWVRTSTLHIAAHAWEIREHSDCPTECPHRRATDVIAAVLSYLTHPNRLPQAEHQ